MAALASITLKLYPMDYVDGKLLVDPDKMMIDGYGDIIFALSHARKPSREHKRRLRDFISVLIEQQRIFDERYGVHKMKSEPLPPTWMGPGHLKS